MSEKHYVIRHPGTDRVDGAIPTYVCGDDPQALHDQFFEGFNPVYELIEWQANRAGRSEG